MTKPGLSYVVPVYNEEGAIADTLARLGAALGQLDRPWEIIVVNDGSSDRSAELAAAVDGVRVVSHPINSGYGSALKTGIVSARYDWVGIVDADGTYPIERLGDLVAEMDKGFDMVVAQRSNVKELDRPIKRVFRGLFKVTINLLLRRKVLDPNSGFRIFRRDMAIMFLPFLCDAFSFTTSITVFAFGANFFVKYVPVDYSARQGETKVRHIRDSMHTAQLVFQGISYFNPAKFYILFFLFFLFGFVTPSSIIGYLGHWESALILFFTGMTLTVLAGIGMLCDVLRIANVHTAVKTVPFLHRTATHLDQADDD